MKLPSWPGKDRFFDIVYVAFSLFLLSVISWLPLPLAQMKLLVYIIDGYWVLVLILAALRSSEFAPRGGVIPLPNRLIGLILFLSCFTYEVFAFGDMYYSICDDFKSAETKDVLNEKSDAYYLSLGTMTTIDIVDFSATSDAAKELKAFQIVSNFLMFFSIFPLLMARLSSFKDVPSRRLKKNNDEKFRTWPFKATTIKEITGIAPEEWCDFSGIFVLDQPPLKKSDFDFDGEYPLLTMSAADGSVNIKMTFDLTKDIKTITISEFYLGSEAATFNPKVFTEIIDLARREQFSKIILSVSKEASLKQIGLTRWEEFGFTVSQSFNTAIQPFAKSANSLHELLQTEDGKTFWQGNGIHWVGEFSLKNGSLNLDQWKEFRRRQ